MPPASLKFVAGLPTLCNSVELKLQIMWLTICARNGRQRSRRAKVRSSLRSEHLHLRKLGEVVPIVGVEASHIVGEHCSNKVQIKDLLARRLVFLEERQDSIENIRPWV